MLSHTATAMERFLRGDHMSWEQLHAVAALERL